LQIIFAFVTFLLFYFVNNITKILIHTMDGAGMRKKRQAFMTFSSVDGKRLHSLGLCPHCQRLRIRDDQWFVLNDYAFQHLDAEYYSHTCPRCAKRKKADKVEI
jgi:hypothetical protein